ncbi:hypothetical protein PAPYR_3940 [Paratrimastix pyriformis]|uniref:UBX domain-containing protein n=1 Tax=Paratrimastix pyriformis TaxID=342808 RepID=A0ABQ8UL06_9EUKA|nr:hypothetical protein PAPYR_3940 [Paratrimastix pyriformis]
MKKPSFCVIVECRGVKHRITVEENELFPSFQEKVAIQTGIPSPAQHFEGITLPPGDLKRKAKLRAANLDNRLLRVRPSAPGESLAPVHDQGPVAPPPPPTFAPPPHMYSQIPGRGCGTAAPPPRPHESPVHAHMPAAFDVSQVPALICLRPEEEVPFPIYFESRYGSNSACFIDGRYPDAVATASSVSKSLLIYLHTESPAGDDFCGRIFTPDLCTFIKSNCICWGLNVTFPLTGRPSSPHPALSPPCLLLVATVGGTPWASSTSRVRPPARRLPPTNVLDAPDPPGVSVDELFAQLMETVANLGTAGGAPPHVPERPAGLRGLRGAGGAMGGRAYLDDEAGHHGVPGRDHARHAPRRSPSTPLVCDPAPPTVTTTATASRSLLPSCSCPPVGLSPEEPHPLMATMAHWRVCVCVNTPAPICAAAGPGKEESRREERRQREEDARKAREEREAGGRGPGRAARLEEEARRARAQARLQAVVAEPAEGDPAACTLQVRLPNSHTMSRRFHKSNTIQDVINAGLAAFPDVATTALQAVTDFPAAPTPLTCPSPLRAAPYSSRPTCPPSSPPCPEHPPLRAHPSSCCLVRRPSLTPPPDLATLEQAGLCPRAVLNLREADSVTPPPSG